MQVLSRSKSMRSSRRKATTMLEFALILPIFMFMLLFVIDMGHLILMSGAMQDATYSSARTGAQVGGAAIDGKNNVTVCGGSSANGSTCSAGSTFAALQDEAQQTPGYGKLGSLNKSDAMTIVHGAICTQNSPNDHVVIQTKYHTSLLTPGLGPLLHMFTGGNGPSTDGWTLTATAVARCQVTRS